MRDHSGTACFYPRKLIALLCLVTVLLVALSPDASGLAYALLSPFWLLLAILVLIDIRPGAEDREPGLFPFLPALPARAPPFA